MGDSLSDASTQQGPSLSEGPSPISSAKSPAWLRVIPFFVSALLFLSGIFAIFSPLPLLLLRLQSGRKWSLIGVFTNFILVILLGGYVSSAFYVIYVLALVLSLPEFLLMRPSIKVFTPGVGSPDMSVLNIFQWTSARMNRVAWLTVLVMGLTAGVILLMVGLSWHVNPFMHLKNEVNALLDMVLQSLSLDTKNQVLNGAEPAEWKHAIILELPSAVVILALAMVWANLVLILKLNPRQLLARIGVDLGFIKRWKSPEYLVWPTLLCGFLMLIDLSSTELMFFKNISDVALNVFKILMAVYAIHGLSVLSFWLDAWGLKGIMRSAAFGLAIFVMLPLVLSLGFFDLWFDFRSKLRQS